MIKDYGANFKKEIVCDRCNWSWFAWDVEELTERLGRHIADMHEKVLDPDAVTFGSFTGGGGWLKKG